MRYWLFFLFITVVLGESIYAQAVIWSENFNSYSNGTNSGGTGSTWTGVCGACLSGDYFEVRSGRFSAGDVNDFSTWETSPIDISGSTEVQFSIDAIENGDHEGPGCFCGTDIDYLDISYSIDGGPFIVIEDWNGDGEPGHTLTGDSNGGTFTDSDWGTTTVSQGGISGATLQLRVVMRNTSGSEVLSIDNIVVQEVSTLPVELIKFEGISTPEGNLLSWSTSSEQNNSHFILEKSEDLHNFESIGHVQGNGTTANEVSNYSYIDREVKNLSYYRLVQVDFDGTRTYSKIIAISNKSIATPFPNPFNDDLFLTLSEKSKVQLITVDGKKSSSYLYLEAGKHNIQELTSNIPSGMVLLFIDSDSSTEVFKLIKR